MGLGDFVSGIFGSKNEGHTDAPTTDPNAYQYGGAAGGAAARQNQLSGLGQQAAATGAAGNNYSGTTQYQNGQNGALGLAAQQANGQDFGAVQAQLNQSTAQQQAMAAAQAAGSRGGGAALAAGQNTAANVSGAQGANAVNQAAQLKANIQMQGIQTDLQGNQAALAQQAQMAQANGQLGLGYAGVQQGYENMNDQTAQAQLAAQQAQQAQNSANQLGADQINAGVNQQNANTNNIGGMFGAGTVASAAGGLATPSDVNAKTGIVPEGAGPIPVETYAPIYGINTEPAVPTGGAQVQRKYSPGASALAPSAVKGAPNAPSTEAMNKANTAVAQALGGAPAGSGGKDPNGDAFSSGMQAGSQVSKIFNSLSGPGGAGAGAAAPADAGGGGGGGSILGSIGSAIGGLFSSSDYNAKANVAGESALAKMDAQTANFSKESAGMQAWSNLSNAQPWSSAAEAAQANENHFSFTSDKNAKTQTKRESVSAADLKALAALDQEVDDRNLGMQMQGTAIQKAEWDRNHPKEAAKASAADQYMATATPFTYDYKNPAENGGERRLGIMAQNLEQGPTGRDLVKDTPAGKVVDVPALASANAAAVGRLHERQTATEQKIASLLGDNQPAWSPADVPSLEPKKHGIVSAYDGITPLTSDAHAKKEVRDEGFVQGAKMGAQQAAAQLGGGQAPTLAAPGYNVPTVMNDEQRTRVLQATDFARQHPEISAAMVQQHIDDAMTAKPSAPSPPVAGLAGYNAQAAMPPPQVTDEERARFQQQAMRSQPLSLGARIVARRSGQ